MNYYIQNSFFANLIIKHKLESVSESSIKLLMSHSIQCKNSDIFESLISSNAIDTNQYIETFSYILLVHNPNRNNKSKLINIMSRYFSNQRLTNVSAETIIKLMDDINTSGLLTYDITQPNAINHVMLFLLQSDQFRNTSQDTLVQRLLESIYQQCPNLELLTPTSNLSLEFVD